MNVFCTFRKKQNMADSKRNDKIKVECVEGEESHCRKKLEFEPMELSYEERMENVENGLEKLSFAIWSLEKKVHGECKGEKKTTGIMENEFEAFICEAIANSSTYGCSRTFICQWMTENKNITFTRYYQMRLGRCLRRLVEKEKIVSRNKLYKLYEK